MQKINIEYLKCQDHEVEIEDFWLRIKKEVLLTEDTTNFDFEIKRYFIGAISGEFAGIIIEIALTLPSCVLATIELWKEINDHFKVNRDKNRISRVLNISVLENLCRYVLLNKGVKNFSMIKSKKLIQKNELVENKDFEYNDDAYKCNVAKFIFETKKYRFTYVIDNDGEITNFKKSKLNST